MVNSFQCMTNTTCCLGCTYYTFLLDPCSLSTTLIFSVTLIIAYPFGVIPQGKHTQNTTISESGSPYHF